MLQHSFSMSVRKMGGTINAGLLRSTVPFSWVLMRCFLVIYTTNMSILTCEVFLSDSVTKAGMKFHPWPPVGKLLLCP